jgi:CheY-like chemotaxis protein
MSLLALVADDDPPSLELARYLLANGGFEVVCAPDGGEALSMAAAHRPDVIVLDLELPVLDGCQVRQRLAADPATSGIPVVVVSVLAIEEACHGHGPADFAGYIAKPVEPTTFASQVRAAITRPVVG